MNTDVISMLHDIRSKVASVKGMVHMHMMGDKRFTCEKELDELETITGKLWALCMSCSGVSPPTNNPDKGGG